MKTQSIFILSLVLLLAVLISAKTHAQSRYEAIGKLQAWRESFQDRSDLDDREKDLRLQFINRLIFQVERKYQENDFRGFLQNTLEEMTEIDRLQTNQSFGAMPIFLENLNLSLRYLLEQNEKPLQLIQSFTEYSGISDPASHEEFADTRTYYDGNRTQSAQALSIEEAAAHLEEYEMEKARLERLEDEIQQEKLKQAELEKERMQQELLEKERLENEFALTSDPLGQPEYEWIDFRENLRQDFVP